jgi:hypothetical protein
MMSKPTDLTPPSLSPLTSFAQTGLKKTRGIAVSSFDERLTGSTAMTATGSPPTPARRSVAASDRS